jgi:Domain of unknown function (DUF4287)
MSFQAYLDNVKAKTGKTPEDFAKLASQKGLAKHGDIVKWLKSEFLLGHGHATAVAAVVTRKMFRRQARMRRSVRSLAVANSTGVSLAKALSRKSRSSDLTPMSAWVGRISVCCERARNSPSFNRPHPIGSISGLSSKACRQASALKQPAAGTPRSPTVSAFRSQPKSTVKSFPG